MCTFKYIYICVYARRRGRVLFLALQMILCIHVWVYGCVRVCVYVGDGAFEGELRLLGVIMRTNAEH